MTDKLRRFLHFLRRKTSCTALSPAIHRRPRYPPPQGHSSLTGGYAPDPGRVQGTLDPFFERNKNVIQAHDLKLVPSVLVPMITKHTRQDRELVPWH